MFTDEFSEAEIFVVKGIDDAAHGLDVAAEVFAIAGECSGGSVTIFQRGVDRIGSHFTRFEGEENPR